MNCIFRIRPKCIFKLKSRNWLKLLLKLQLRPMKKILLLLLVLLNACLLVSADNYTLVLLSQERGAACLDGSPVGLYINEGKG